MPQLYPTRRYTRAKAPLGIVRGYSPTDPGRLSVTAEPKLGEGIKQGMAITLDNNGQWVKAPSNASTALNISVFVARQDQDDPAVQSSNKLTGLDCSGSYELLTGYVVAGTYGLDAELTIEPGTGNFTLATTGKKVVGKVSKVGNGLGGLIAWAPTPSGRSGGTAPGSIPPTATAADAARLQFKTVQAYLKA